MYTYLKFGLPRVFPPNGVRGREGSSGYDSSEDGASHRGPRTAAERKARAQYLRARSDPDFRNLIPNGVRELRVFRDETYEYSSSLCFKVIGSFVPIQLVKMSKISMVNGMLFYGNSSFYL